MEPGNGERMSQAACGPPGRRADNVHYVSYVTSQSRRLASRRVVVTADASAFANLPDLEVRLPR